MKVELCKHLRALKHITVVLFAVSIMLGVIHFPMTSTRRSLQEVDAARKYYTEAYQKPITDNPEKSEYETEYLRVAQSAAEALRIEDQIRAFVQHFNLSDRPVLEIGSGRGYLQNIAQNYTGLDISPSVARFYHKNLFSAPPRHCPFQTTASTQFGLFGCSSMYPIPSRRFMRLNV